MPFAGATRSAPVAFGPPTAAEAAANDKKQRKKAKHLTQAKKLAIAEQANNDAQADLAEAHAYTQDLEARLAAVESQQAGSPDTTADLEDAEIHQPAANPPTTPSQSDAARASTSNNCFSF